MTKSEHKIMTLCFLRTSDRVLLGLKKTGLGKDKFNGIGGKLEKDETVYECMVREVKEEVGVTVLEARPVATLFFSYLDCPKNDCVVYVYTSNKFVGEPKESDEMTPVWYPSNEMPYMDMWEDDRHWLPHVLIGRHVVGEFVYGEHLFCDNIMLLFSDFAKDLLIRDVAGEDGPHARNVRMRRHFWKASRNPYRPHNIEPAVWTHKAKPGDPGPMFEEGEI